MIETTKAEVEAHYNTDNGYETNAQVIYGDTDSVMVKFGCKDIETAMKLGKALFFLRRISGPSMLIITHCRRRSCD
jgi:DNA polymerase elongation subunit (family B)